MDKLLWPDLAEHGFQPGTDHIVVESSEVELSGRRIEGADTKRRGTRGFIGEFLEQGQ